MTKYQEILRELKEGKCNYGNGVTGVFYSIGQTMMKMNSNGKMKFFSSLEQMARSINKFLKTGY